MLNSTSEASPAVAGGAFAQVVSPPPPMYVGVFVFQGGGGGVAAVSGQAVYVRRGGAGQEWTSR